MQVIYNKKHAWVHFLRTYLMYLFQHAELEKLLGNLVYTVRQSRLAMTGEDRRGSKYEADFVKIAVNVVREPGNPRNQLPTILRGWFGSDTGLPGTNFRVRLKKTESGWSMEPTGGRPDRDTPALS